MGGGFCMGLAGMLLLVRWIFVVDAAVEEPCDAGGGDARQRSRRSQEAAPDETLDQIVVHLDRTFPHRRWAVNHVAPAAVGDRSQTAHRGSSPSQIVVTSRSRAWSKSAAEAGIV